MYAACTKFIFAYAWVHIYTTQAHMTDFGTKKYTKCANAYTCVHICFLPSRYRIAKSYLAGNAHLQGNAYLLAHVLQQRARLLDQQARIRSLHSLFRDAKSVALRALAAFEELRAANDAEATRQLLQQIEADVLGISNDDGEPPRDNPPCCALC